MGLPVQAIPSKEKTEQWFKATMDALEHIGLVQLQDNQKYKDFYRMKDGKLSYMELKDMIPYLREVQEVMDRVNIPSFLKHYDLVGTIINAFVGWLGNMSDKYNVVGLDDTEINQYTETKERLFHNYIQEVFNNTLNARLMEMGLDPTYNNFQSEEERQQYQQQIEQAKVTMTPPEIEKFMNTKWKSAEVMWASHTLENDRQRFYMDELDKDNFIDYLLTGKCFRNYHVGYDYYRPERWSPLNTFYSHTLDSKYPQYGEYIGRVHYYTASAIISRWGHAIKAKDKQKLVGGFRSYMGSYYWAQEGRGHVSLQKAASLGMVYQNEIIPFKGYHDYASIRAYEKFTGMPQGIYTGVDSDGNEYHRARFLPDLEYRGHTASHASLLTDDFVRPDLYQVTEAYWVSPKQIYIITYQSPTGLVSQEIVTDELLKEFLTENGIRKITRTMEKGVREPEVNTYFVDYVPEVRYGVKITGGGLEQAGLYLFGDPIEHQIKGDSNLYDFCLPVAGYVDAPLAIKLQPYQVLYNYAINQIVNILENEIGTFFLADVNLVPSEYKNMGDDVQDVFANLMEAAKATGGMLLDTSQQNTRGGVPFNQFGVYNLSQTDRLKTRMEIAEWAKTKCFEQIGITPQVINGPNKYETATGVQQGVTASMLQTEIYFDNFEHFKRRALDLHLAVAQNCQAEGRDISVMYTKSDMTRAFLQIGTDGLSMRHLGVQAISNSKKRQELETFKQYMMQINTAGGDIFDLASLFTSDSMVELTQIARNARSYAEKQARQQQENELQLQQQKLQADAEEKERDRQHELQLESLKGEYRLRQEMIQASGYAANRQSDPASWNYMAQMQNLAVKQADAERQKAMAEAEMEENRRQHDDNMELEREKLRLKEKEIDQREKTNQANKYIAGINKN